MSEKDRTISPKVFLVGALALVVIGVLVCIALYSIRSTIAALIIPQDGDFPGLREELNVLGTTPDFASASWIGNLLNEVEINGYAPEDTPVEVLRLVQCPALLDIAHSFVGEKFDIEVHVTGSSRIPCN